MYISGTFIKLKFSEMVVFLFSGEANYFENFLSHRLQLITQYSRRILLKMFSFSWCKSLWSLKQILHVRSSCRIIYLIDIVKGQVLNSQEVWWIWLPTFLSTSCSVKENSFLLSPRGPGKQIILQTILTVCFIVDLNTFINKKSGFFTLGQIPPQIITDWEFRHLSIKTVA